MNQQDLASVDIFVTIIKGIAFGAGAALGFVIKGIAFGSGAALGFVLVLWSLPLWT